MSYEFIFFSIFPASLLFTNTYIRSLLACRIKSFRQIEMRETKSVTEKNIDQNKSEMGEAGRKDTLNEWKSASVDATWWLRMKMCEFD